ncbi:glutathione S-transferase N-terminal domain-containing protein [Candidatus Pacearchaeota archaeon]|nr:glutathione S-transferase N-terminal domain-containing protein [Candidatus Pacearchaeota archaeon]
MTKKVVLYSTKWCPWCKRVREFLKFKKIKFVERDVEKNKKYREEAVKKSKQMGIPVTDIDGKIIVGFNEEKLRKELGIK